MVLVVPMPIRRNIVVDKLAQVRDGCQLCKLPKKHAARSPARLMARASL